MKIETTLENLYEEPVDPAPLTEEEADELIDWFDYVKGIKKRNSEID